MVNPIRSILERRAPFKTAQGRRIRTLFHAFMDKLDAANPLHVAMALRASELQVAAEEARATLLAGDNDAGDDVVRLDNTARRAAKELGHFVVGDEEPDVPWTAAS